ncbi:MAG: restriction endonuclease subunit S [Gammaproteobacteria bacterium]|nr:restriction endonuclease subunit S [Gammaproteobacteria bacterium]
MTYPTYSEYENSGVEWLGEIPKHWEVKRISYVALLKSGDSIVSEQIKESGDYPVYGGNGLRGFFESYNHEGSYALIGRQGALCGNINYTHGKFWASEHAIVVHPSPFVNFRWFGETLKAMNLNQ